MSSSQTFVGTPSAMLLPAEKHKVEHLSGLASFTVPIRGTFSENSPRPGQTFDVMPERDVILFGTLTEVLFAEKVYPSLEKDQRFVFSGVEWDDETITVVGRVVKITLSEE